MNEDKRMAGDYEIIHAMPHIRFHDLRHSAATNMHELTGDFSQSEKSSGTPLKVSECRLAYLLIWLMLQLGMSMCVWTESERYSKPTTTRCFRMKLSVLRKRT